MNLRIGLDVDGVVCDWWGGIIAAAKSMGLRDEMPLHANWVTSWYGSGAAFDKVWKAVAKSEEWWMSLQPIKGARESINFPVFAFITARPCESKLTLAWLRKHGFETEWVYTMSRGRKKIDAMLANGVDVLVDDKPQIFEEVRANGTKKAFLMDQPWNRLHDDVGLRIKSLAEVPQRLGLRPPPTLTEGGLA